MQGAEYLASSDRVGAENRECGGTRKPGNLPGFEGSSVRPRQAGCCQADPDPQAEKSAPAEPRGDSVARLDRAQHGYDRCVVQNKPGEKPKCGCRNHSAEDRPSCQQREPSWDRGEEQQGTGCGECKQGTNIALHDHRG